MARHKGLSFYRRKKKISSTILREIFSWIAGIFIAIFIGLVAVYFFGMTTTVVGASMEDTLYNGQKVLINRFTYILSSPEYGDVVAFLPNGNENSHYYVKRVLGKPGDKILIKNGILFVNGIESKYVGDKILDPGIAENEFVLGSGEYFCMGDSPNNSEDSRSANIGPVKESNILGKVWFKFKYGDGTMGFVK